jgi:menaquinone-dependent protoporphyrinogen oxidase
MHVLVAYASRHGATQGIAERIAETLKATGIDAEAQPVASVKSAAGYDAFVIGSAAYMFHWLREAVALVRHNRGVLAAKPVWLFSSGPLGTDAFDAQGRDQKVVAVPKEIPELANSVHAREHHVFFGAYQPDGKPTGPRSKLGYGDRPRPPPGPCARSQLKATEWVAGRSRTIVARDRAAWSVSLPDRRAPLQAQARPERP